MHVNDPLLTYLCMHLVLLVLTVDRCIMQWHLNVTLVATEYLWCTDAIFPCSSVDALLPALFFFNRVLLFISR